MNKAHERAKVQQARPNDIDGFKSSHQPNIDGSEELPKLTENNICFFRCNHEHIAFKVYLQWWMNTWALGMR